MMKDILFSNSDNKIIEARKKALFGYKNLVDHPSKPENALPDAMRLGAYGAILNPMTEQSMQDLTQE